MGKFILSLVVCITLSAYDMRPHIYSGTWSIKEETADTKQVIASGETIILLDRFKLDAGQKLVICHKECKPVRIIVKDQKVAINGSIASNCRVEFCTFGLLSLGENALLKGLEVSIEAIGALCLEGKVQAPQIQLFSKGPIAIKGEVMGDTNIKTQHSVDIEGKVQCNHGEIRINTGKFHLKNAGLLDVSASSAGVIAIESDKIWIDESAKINASAIGQGGRIHIVTKKLPKLEGLLSVASSKGHGGLISICCDQGRPELKNMTTKGPLGDGKVIIDF